MSLRLNRRHFLGTAAATAAAASMPLRARASTPFTMQAAWINDAEFAGYFIGIDEGYYAEEGLDLTYLSGGPDVIPESTIIAGRADLALTTPDTTIKAISEQGAPFKIIGAQYQKNPIGIVSLVSNPINEPRDLIGKTLAVPPVNVISVQAMLKMNDIDPGEVNIVPYAYDPTPLLRARSTPASISPPTCPTRSSRQGVEATSFLLYDFGFTIYNDTVVVTEETCWPTKRDLLVAVAARLAPGLGRRTSVTRTSGRRNSPIRGSRARAGASRTRSSSTTRSKPLMESPAGYIAMTEEGIEANLTRAGGQSASTARARCSTRRFWTRSERDAGWNLSFRGGKDLSRGGARSSRRCAR
jgi:hypothetical protein